MKRLLLTSALVALSVSAFAQGKVNTINDSASLITLTTQTSLLKTADVSQQGAAVGNLTPLLSGTVLVAGLYGGTSSSSLFLYSTVSLTDQGTPGGYILGTHMVLNAIAATGAPAIPGIANGTAIGATTPWLEIKVWDSAYPTWEAANTAGAYRSQAGVGAMQPFQFNPGPSLSYPNTAPPGVNSTWTEGNFVVSLVPEPSTFALAGLGAAALMIFRRRK